jgi:hypothetical protein
MASRAPAGRQPVAATDPSIRILRWTFRRADQAVVCELGLNNDRSAYELRLNPPSHRIGTNAEVFDDAMSAFQRQVAIERILVGDGWMLDGFESQQVLRATA